jgi:hypothetical protein
MLDFHIYGATPGFIGMLSIQEGGLRAPLVEYINRGKLPFDRPVRTAVSLVRTSGREDNG